MLTRIASLMLLILTSAGGVHAEAIDGIEMPPLATLQRVETADGASFAECAAYYFLAARGHPAGDYDRLYSSGEFSLNSATLLHGRKQSGEQMEQRSGEMMTAMQQDWRQIEVLDRRHAEPCAALVSAAGFNVK